MRTVLFLRFSEPDGVAPSDEMGTLEDLVVDPLLQRPPRVTDPSWTGGGHLYFADNPDGWVAADAADGDSVLQRDVTIQALVTFDVTNAVGAACIICRGLGGSASERYAWGLELAEQAGNPGHIEIRWVWQNQAGTDAVVMPGVYQHAGDTAELLITATRRWVSTTQVVCRYYVNGTLLAEVTTDDGDIGGGTSGHTSVGARKMGGWGNGYSGVIDQIKVTDYEMSAEEIAAVYERMTLHQPNGVASLRALAPPGVPWSDKADSDVGKLLTLTGQALGYGHARAEEQRRNGLPHRAYADTIAPWERLVGLPNNERLALDTRRERVVAHLSRDNGYAPPQVRQALSGPFDQAADDVELLEYSPSYTDNFATLEVERWHQEPAAGAWSIVAGGAQLFRATGADLRFSEIDGYNPTHLRTPITSAERLVASVKMSSAVGVMPAFCMAGLFLYRRAGNDALWFGVRFEGGSYRIGWRALVGGVLGAFTILQAATAAPWWFRARRDDAAGAGRYLLDWSSDGFVASNSTAIVNAGIADPNYVGVGAVSTIGATGLDLDVTFDDFFVREPGGVRACHWYGFRDLGLPGSPDMLGANAVVQTIKPAHTYAAAITSRSLLCDNAGTGCDHGPLGGL